MDFDGFVSFMARYNSALYPNHDNFWMRIHLIDPSSLRPASAKAFKSFKSRISKAVKNLSQDDLEKLINMDKGMRPHPNTFILKKFGIPTSMYETVRYAAFNHARHLSAGQNLPPIPRAHRENAESIQDEIKRIADESSRSIQSSISSVKNEIMMNLDEMIASAISERLKKMKSSIVDEVANRSYSEIARELDKAVTSIKKNEGNSFVGGFIGGTIGGALVSLVSMLAGKNKAELTANDLAATVNVLSVRLSNAENDVKNLEATLLYLKSIVEPLLDLEDGYNYLKAFGVPITRQDWDMLSDQTKKDWSPFRIKPPLWDETKISIAKAIKRNEPPSVSMCYDF